MVTIFSEHITDRLKYVLDFCFEQKNQPYQIITSTEEWLSLEVQDLNYSYLELPSKLQINPQGILLERDIYQSKKITKGEKGLEIDGVHDQLGIIFYLLSRYESYFSEKQDHHGRLVSQENTLVRLGLNKTAVVDQIIKEIWSALKCDYSGIEKGFRFSPSFDIDVAWAYKNRSFVRSVGGLLKGKRPFERVKVLTGLKKDPYDTYSEIRAIATETEDVICFILLGDWGKYDKNIHWENLSYGSLIRGLNLEGEIGIHPSYEAHLNHDKTVGEIKRLEKITGHEIFKSRQHFLRLKIPETYQLLLKAGVKYDFSMGFADQVGFRAGTCFPFYFFDLLTNEKTELLIQPFVYMDSALKDYMKLSPNKSKTIIEELMQEVRSVGGRFMFIWHNSSINDQSEWKGWKEVLDFTIEKGINR